MRTSFRNFATSVVMPLAEKIHTHDLIVPEAILKPLVELEPLVCRFPMQYGGIQPDDKGRQPGHDRGDRRIVTWVAGCSGFFDHSA